MAASGILRFLVATPQKQILILLIRHGFVKSINGTNINLGYGRQWRQNSILQDADFLGDQLSFGKELRLISHEAPPSPQQALGGEQY